MTTLDLLGFFVYGDGTKLLQMFISKRKIPLEINLHKFFLRVQEKSINDVSLTIYRQNLTKNDFKKRT